MINKYNYIKGRCKFMLAKILFELSDAYREELSTEISISDLSPLLGEICMNRIVGLSYQKLVNYKKLDFLTDFINTINFLYSNEVERARRYKNSLSYLTTIFENCSFEYAFLKGAYLSSVLYKEGMRNSNDFDILINECDIQKCQNLLQENGFVQGSLNNNGEIIKASRRQILESRINFGETVPFIKIVNNIPIAMDLNFSLDYKPENEKFSVSKMLASRRLVNTDLGKFYTLNEYDFLIHLCCHLYKEATTINWVAENRDLQLYKFSDINIYLHKYGTRTFFESLYNKIIEGSFEKECFFTFYYSMIIYPNLKNIEGMIDFMHKFDNLNQSFLKEIIDPADGKYTYNMDFINWFECKNKKDFFIKLN